MNTQNEITLNETKLKYIYKKNYEKTMMIDVLFQIIGEIL